MVVRYTESNMINNEPHHEYEQIPSLEELDAAMPEEFKQVERYHLPILKDDSDEISRFKQQPRFSAEMKRVPTTGTGTNSFYRVWDRQEQRMKVLKTIPMEVADYIFREAEAYKDAEHPLVLHIDGLVYALLTVKGSADIASSLEVAALLMDYVPPEVPTVEHLIQRNQVSVDLVKHITEELSDLVAELATDRGEKKQLLHNDIKPEQMFFPDGHIRLFDFGVTVRPGEAEQATHLYSSPEKYLEQPTYLPSEVYSIALTAMELLAGKQIQAPRGEDEQDEMEIEFAQRVHTNQEYSPEEIKAFLLGTERYQQRLQELAVTDIAEEFTEHLAQVFYNALRFDPNQRTQNPLEFAQAFVDTLTVTH
jgi:serine/threonine protein kinase